VKTLLAIERNEVPAELRENTERFDLDDYETSKMQQAEIAAEKVVIARARSYQASRSKTPRCLSAVAWVRGTGNGATDTLLPRAATRALVMEMRPSDAYAAWAVAEQSAVALEAARGAPTMVAKRRQGRSVDPVGVVVLLNLDRHGRATCHTHAAGVYGERQTRSSSSRSRRHHLPQTFLQKPEISLQTSDFRGDLELTVQLEAKPKRQRDRVCRRCLELFLGALRPASSIGDFDEFASPKTCDRLTSDRIHLLDRVQTLLSLQGAVAIPGLKQALALTGWEVGHFIHHAADLPSSTLDLAP
jgi:hypothetical protein